ncbi:MAG: response regulator [Clostridium sp.]|uniref:response regulator n=1 Tax=Clostridium sp. TaxID=1506 RepID=UPI0030351599
MKKALVVDDTKNIRKLLKTSLELNEYLVTEAPNGMDAIEILSSETFDLIFLDVKMPTLSGTEVLKRIREDGIFSTVIIMTAFPTVKNAVDCTKLGAVEYLLKPFTTDKINSLVHRLNSANKDTKALENILKGVSKLMQLKKYEDSILLLNKALSIDATNPNVYKALAECYEGLGDNINRDKFFNCYTTFKL